MKCAHPRCKKEVPKVALLAGDLHCSTICFRIDHGTMSVEAGRDLEERSEKGRESSHVWREQAAASWRLSGRSRANA